MSEAPTTILTFKKESNAGKKYALEIKALNEYLNIHIASEATIPCCTYEKKVYLSEVKNNRYLSICNNIQELFLSLEPQLKETNGLKLIEDKNKLDLIIPLPSPLVKEVAFSIPKVEKDVNMEIKDLYRIINQQQDLINKLNERVSLLEKKEEERKRKEEEEEKQYFICKNSKIIENEREKDLALRKWINPNRKDFEIKLLFRMSRDGNKSSEYHRLCDNKNNLLTIIETDTNKKFGGFASQSWSVKGQNIEKTFMFSLNDMKKFDRINNEKSKWNGPSYGPIFGNAWDIYINSTMTTGCEQHNSNSVFLTDKNFINNGNNSTNFNVKEIEVFKIE